MKIKRKLDKKDRFIISELIKDGRTKYTHLAKKLNITPAAVKERVEKLISSNFIKPSILINQNKFFSLTSVVGIEADSEGVDILVKKLKNCPLVISMIKTSGMHNLILHVASKDMQQLESFLNNQIRCEPGIKHVEVNIGNTPIIPSFQQIRLYEFKDRERVPCSIRKDEKEVCLGCPGLEKWGKGE
jgi:DNA-binding Lrp family transcriptional regulator